MRFKLATAGSLLIVSLTVGGSPNKGQDQNHSSTVRGPDKQERTFAVNLVRAINTAEMAYRDKEGGSFAEWNALSASQGFKQAIDNFSRDVSGLKDLDLSAPAEITPGWGLSPVSCRTCAAYQKKASVRRPRPFHFIPAATYVPTQLPVQYHRPSEA